MVAILERMSDVLSESGSVQSDEESPARPQKEQKKGPPAKSSACVLL